MHVYSDTSPLGFSGAYSQESMYRIAVQMVFFPFPLSEAAVFVNILPQTLPLSSYNVQRTVHFIAAVQQVQERGAHM